MKKPALLFLTLLVSAFAFAQNAKLVRTSFPAADGLTVTGWEFKGDSAHPWMLLCHQAGYSKGEYQITGQLLARMGYNCLAIDQRSGKEVNEVKNETAELAKKTGKGMTYLDAEQDIVAGLEYAYSKSGKPVILVGSSYSAALVLKVAAEHPDKVKAIISFSPAEYFGDKLTIAGYCGKLTMPVFITSAKDEADRAKVLFDAIISKTKTQFIPESKGKHGSSALWASTVGNEEYWTALKVFLKQLQ